MDIIKSIITNTISFLVAFLSYKSKRDLEQKYKINKAKVDERERINKKAIKAANKKINNKLDAIRRRYR